MFGSICSSMHLTPRRYSNEARTQTESRLCVKINIQMKIIFKVSLLSNITTYVTLLFNLVANFIKAFDVV